MIDVTCAIIVEGNKVLVTQRSEKMSLPLKWEFPGGKIEENETAESCVLREIKEELNLEIEIITRLESKKFDYPAFSINLIPFISKYLSGIINLNEHKDYKWVTKEEMKLLDWAPADIQILQEFLNINYEPTRPLRTNN